MNSIKKHIRAVYQIFVVVLLFGMGGSLIAMQTAVRGLVRFAGRAMHRAVPAAGAAGNLLPTFSGNTPAYPQSLSLPSSDNMYIYSGCNAVAAKPDSVSSGTPSSGSSFLVSGLTNVVADYAVDKVVDGLKTGIGSLFNWVKDKVFVTEAPSNSSSTAAIGSPMDSGSEAPVADVVESADSDLEGTVGGEPVSSSDSNPIAREEVSGEPVCSSESEDAGELIVSEAGSVSPSLDESSHNDGPRVGNRLTPPNIVVLPLPRKKKKKEKPSGIALPEPVIVKDIKDEVKEKKVADGVAEQATASKKGWLSKIWSGLKWAAPLLALGGATKYLNSGSQSDEMVEDKKPVSIDSKNTVKRSVPPLVLNEKNTLENGKAVNPSALESLTSDSKRGTSSVGLNNPTAPTVGATPRLLSRSGKPILQRGQSRGQSRGRRGSGSSVDRNKKIVNNALNGRRFRDTLNTSGFGTTDSKAVGSPGLKEDTRSTCLLDCRRTNVSDDVADSVA